MTDLKIIMRIARTDLAILFYSPIAWFILIVFSFLTTASFTSLMENIVTDYDLSGGKEVSLSGICFLGSYGFLSSVVSNIYIYIPLLTMGLISRETASGSIKLAYSSPVTSGQIVLGKYLAAIGFGCCLMLVPIASAIYGSLVIPSFDWAPVLVALLGLYLLICAYCAIGLFMSSLTTYQVVAAVGTLIILAILNFVGSIGQEYDLIRELTYWLSINGRTIDMLNGVIRSEDVIYFVVVVTLFLTFTTFKLTSDRCTISRFRQAISYLGFFVAAMAIGYFTSRPGMIKVWDTTRTRLNSLTENSQHVLAKLTGPVTITNYVNLLDNKSYRYLPIMKKANETIFEPYCLAKPDLQVKYVYYYDFAPNGVANNPKFQGKTVDEMRDYMTMIYNLNPHLFKSPAEIRQIIDLREEQNTFVRIMETQDGKRTFIRDFEDMDATPSEAEITAAIKKMISTPPTVAFIKGDGEREVSKSGDRDYSNFSIEKYSRAALINQGFDVCEIDISHGDTIPSLINIMVLAEMRTPLTEKGENQLEAYLARGGNLFILTDTGRQEVMNPFLSKLGIKMEEYQLAQSSADFSPNLILAKATRESGKLTFGFKDDFPKYDLRVSMPGCVALTCSDNDYGFQYTPILETNAKGVWIEKEQTDLQESPVECNASAGEKEQTYITAYALSRQLKDKGYKIGIITSASIDHATPGGFYASQPDRSMYYEIGVDAANSGFDFFGGAGLLEPRSKRNLSAPCLYDLFNQKGYTMFRGMDAYNRAAAKDKILLFPTDTVSKSLKYAMDRSAKDLSLPDLTKACLANFQETAKKGFFMMVEGGKIDWAAHAHDGGAVVKETIDFDQCIRLAYDFYKKHPNETLILVTADHETGGLGLGNSDMNLNIDLLQYQKCSQEALTAAMREMKSGKMIPSWKDMKAFLKKNLGFWEQIKITPREELELLVCYEESFLKKKSKDVVSLYAKDEPLAVAAIALLDKKASLGWTTKTHTGAPVPLYAIGKQAVLYSGRRDNTDMANVLRKLFLIK